MGGGGKGGGGSSVQPTYTDPVNGMTFTDSSSYVPDASGPGMHRQTGAEQLNNEITARKATEKTASDAATATATAKTNTDEADFQTRAAAAKTQAGQNINDYFTGQGVDPTKYSKQIADTINTASGSVADLDPNPAGKYATTQGSDLFNQLTSGQQSQNLAGYNKVFDPSYSLTALPGSLSDPSIAQTVNSQFDPLSGQLLNAQKRGSLTTQGYQAALDALNTSKTNATASVGKLAQGVLDSDRGSLNTYIGTGRTAAGSAPLNSQFSTDPYVATAKDMVAKDTSNFSGDVSNAVGATKFSDLTTLLNAGGAAQGATDPSAANPNGAVGPGGTAIGGGSLSPEAIAQQALAQDKRGLGSAGAF